MLSPEAKLLLSKNQQSCKEIIYSFMAHTIKPYKDENEWTDFVQKNTEPERDWEIVSISDGGRIIETDNKGRFRYAAFSEYTLEHALEIGFKIHSVKRLSDGEVFTIDDECVHVLDEEIKFGKITGFKIGDYGSHMFNDFKKNIVVEFGEFWHWINVVSKSKPVLSETDWNKICNVCGSELVFIRGKYPNEDKRKVCPTCSYERLEQINEISNPDYNKCSSSKG